MTTKQTIFDLFYEKKQVTRAGGGTSKSKITRRSPTFTEQEKMLTDIKENKDLNDYYKKLFNRSGDIAPPPRPL